MASYGDSTPTAMTVKASDSVEFCPAKRAEATSSDKKEYMNIKPLSILLPVFFEDKLNDSVRALKDNLKDSLKENCNWNLLHEAVFIDCTPAARILFHDFGFDPNAFDPYFGSAM